MDTTRHSRWRDQLAAVASQPLEYCPGFPEIAARWEDWWHFRAARPLMMASTSSRTDIYWGRGFKFIERPQQWLDALRTQVANTRWIGELLPRVRVDIGPEAPAAFLGTPLHLSESEQTAWNTPNLSSWDPPPVFRFDPENKWFRLVLSLLALTADDARGRYLVCLPDMGGAVDVLANMRDPSLLCMDIMDDAREAVKTAALQIADAWAPMYEQVIDTILSRGAGYINQMSPWSGEDYVVPTCDFNALIGPDDFEEICLPSLRRQASNAARICFHLDGPQAARHAGALGRQDWVRTVQFSPGEGTPSALAKLDMLRGLQEAGKPVLVMAPLREAAELARKLDPRGLAIWVQGNLSPADAAEFEDIIKHLPDSHA
ncbi:hypothetical protein OH491_15805 [Termitidicoccus mucosus]|uniref:Uroporphyrinogen decarboxylase (URO-D) domain-containing protein n=1 Tax=Termitidicoccus mucosus TaxID=1184151 RepID=A0A178IIN2_9BACT|nr:hypothetical protein AW736_12740 [Opitutaceae bacterium TSB47]